MMASLDDEGKVRMMRAVYTSLCEYMTENGYKISRDHPIEIASKEMQRFFASKEGSSAAYKLMQMVAACSADADEMVNQIDEYRRETDLSRN